MSVLLGAPETLLLPGSHRPRPHHSPGVAPPTCSPSGLGSQPQGRSSRLLPSVPLAFWESGTKSDVSSSPNRSSSSCQQSF